MYIVSKNRQSVINVDNSRGLSVKGKSILVYFKSHDEILLGEYDAEERAQEVFEDMLAKCFADRMVAELGTYYMPEG